MTRARIAIAALLTACTPGVDLVAVAIEDGGADARRVEETPQSPQSKDPCVHTDGVIYLTTEANELLAFTPASNELKTVGVFSCPAVGKPSGVIVALGVDMQSKGWALGEDHQLYTLDLSTASCGSTPSALVASPEALTFEPPVGESDTLLLADAKTLYAVGATRAAAKETRTFTDPWPSLRLTALADGSIFRAAFATTKLTIERIDPQASTPGSVVFETKLDGRDYPKYGFAYSGDSFWIFADTVFRLNPKTGEAAPLPGILAKNRIVTSAAAQACPKPHG